MEIEHNDIRQTFVFTVDVIEGRHYPLRNASTYVQVKIARQTRYTNIQRYTEIPFYDERLTFDLYRSLNEILATVIEFSVFKPKTCLRRRRLIGRAIIDASLIMSQPERMVFCKWLLLRLHTGSGGIINRGFLKVSIGISSQGEPARIPETVREQSDDIEKNLLVPIGMEDIESIQAILLFNIYRADYIPKSKSTLSNIFGNRCTNVQVYYAGNRGRTSTSKRTETPVWNEQIRILDMFPPLTQRISIELWDEEMAGRSKMLAQHFINLHDISHDAKKAYLPTFGPTFIHMYNKKSEYVGQILMSIETEPLKHIGVATKNIFVEPIPALIEDQYFHYIPVVLYCALFNVNTITSQLKNKQISFQIEFGSKQNINVKETNQYNTWQTLVYSHNHNNFCSFKDRKPTMFLTTLLPDIRYRIYNSNMLTRISDTLRKDLDEIEKIYSISPHDTILEVLLTETVNNLDELCQQYIERYPKFEGQFQTKLGRHRARQCLETIENIVFEAKTIPNFKFSKRLYRKVQHFLNAIENIVEDQQESWPDIFIRLMHGTKKIGYQRIAARNICFSESPDESGKWCGTLYNTYFLPINTPNVYTYNTPGTLIARVCLYFWLGWYQHKKYCLQSFPKGHTPLKDQNLPLTLFYPTKFVARNTLNPVWNQTIILSNIYIHRDFESLKTFIPELLIEIYDLDKIKRSVRLQGRGTIGPKLKLLNGEYLNNIKPKLQWINFKLGHEIAGEILMEAELLEVNPEENQEQLDEIIDEIPETILPKQVTYRIEVLFWGIRQIRQSLCSLKRIIRPRITIALSTVEIHSSILPTASKFLNFSEPFKYTDVQLPEEIEYLPPISIELFDCRSFGRNIFVATTTFSAKKCLIPIFERNEYESKKLHLSNHQLFGNLILNKKHRRRLQKKLEKLRKKHTKIHRPNTFLKKVKRCCRCMSFWLFASPDTIINKHKQNQLIKSKMQMEKKYLKRKQDNALLQLNEIITPAVCSDLQTDLTWWSKFLTTIDRQLAKRFGNLKLARIKVYNSELEKQKAFSGFNDFLQTFPLFCGKKTGDEYLDMQRAIGKFKGAIRIYRYPTNEDEEYVTQDGYNIKNFVLKRQTNNEPEKVLIRIYIIRGINLRSKDIGSESDPYLKILLGKRLIYNGVKYYQQDEDNPTFACAIETEAQFPEDYLLTVQVWDKDIFTKDDLIGETKIDLEKRYYSKYHANCGIALDYCESGYNGWRDPEKPSEILLNLCQRYDVKEPIYFPNKIIVGPLELVANFPVEKDGNAEIIKQRLSLIALHNWFQIPFVGFHLVPEHVETRSLFNESSPNLEQGKIQLWVDIFSLTQTFIPPAVDITPHKPIPYEIRVIVWNTEDVILVDSIYFTDIKMSDIYVRGWITDRSESQMTDVHYHSITGEGNFNWRFIFHINYLPIENQIVIKKKVSPFSPIKEIKKPCRLTLQVWDNDTITPDDFLGSFNMELARCPRGAKTSKTCTLKIAEVNAPMINLFKAGRTRGWWPFLNYDKKTNEIIGKVELEIEIIPLEEALKRPAGIAREKPQELPEPKRPDLSFSWFRNPLRAMKFLCRVYRWKFVRFLCMMCVTAFVFIGIYSLPGSIVKRLLHF